MSAYFWDKIVCLLLAIFSRSYFCKYKMFYQCYLNLLLNGVKSIINLALKPLFFKEQHSWTAGFFKNSWTDVFRWLELWGVFLFQLTSFSFYSIYDRQFDFYLINNDLIAQKNQKAMVRPCKQGILASWKLGQHWT